MTILAFLQNQYFKNPDKARQVFARNPTLRNKLITSFLFAGCLTGRRLQEALGSELCNQIIWEETSREVGGHSASRFAPDLDHMRNAIETHKPDVVLCFGKIAHDAMRQLQDRELLVNAVIYAPHPASRNNPMPRLREVVGELKYVGTF
jgi:hypothetical protein